MAKRSVHYPLLTIPSFLLLDSSVGFFFFFLSFLFDWFQHNLGVLVLLLLLNSGLLRSFPMLSGAEHQSFLLNVIQIFIFYQFGVRALDLRSLNGINNMEGRLDALDRRVEDLG